MKQCLERCGVFAAAVLVVVSLHLAACGGDRGSGPAAQPDGDRPATPRAGGTLVIGIIADFQGVNQLISANNAVSQDIYHLLYLQLVEEQPDYQDHPPTFKPMLAERWERSADGRSLTFHLRRDVRWSDGEPVTAEDVRFTWQAQRHPDVAWVGASYKEPIEDVEVVDPYTVRFHFSEPFANQLLYANEGAILPRHAWSELPFEQWRQSTDWFDQRAVASGPYRLAGWRKQQEVILERNPSYYQAGLPYIDRVVLRLVADRSNQVTQALAGDLDYIYGLALTDAPRIEGDDDLELVTWWTRGYAFVGWNGRRPLFADPAVRRALTLALDRQEIVDAIYGRFGRVATSPILSDVWAYNREIEPWPYDPEEAAQRLEAAGWRDTDGDGIRDRDGQPFRFELVTNAGNRQREDTCVLIQQQLAKVGIDARPQTQAYNPMVERLDRGDFDATVLRFNMATDLDISAGFATGGPFNIFGYSNPELDRLLAEAKKVDDIADVRRYLDPAQEILHRDQPMTFLYESQFLAALNRRVHGAEPNLLRSYWHLWEWWLEPAG